MFSLSTAESDKGYGAIPGVHIQHFCTDMLGYAYLRCNHNVTFFYLKLHSIGKVISEL